MNATSKVYITTRRQGEAIEILDAHRRLEYARKQLDQLRDEAKAQGCRTLMTEAGCCLRTQKGDTVIYYEITNRELK